MSTYFDRLNWTDFSRLTQTNYINSDELIENVNFVQTSEDFLVSACGLLVMPICISCFLSRYVFIGDAVVLKDPNETNKYLVRRLAALEGSEMVSSDEKDAPFVLEKDQCWVVAENQEMKSKVHCYIRRRKKLCF